MKYQVLCMLFLVGANCYGMDQQEQRTRTATKFMQQNSRKIARDNAAGQQRLGERVFRDDRPLMSDAGIAAIESTMRHKKRIAEEKAAVVATLLKGVAEKKLIEIIEDYALWHYNDATDEVDPFALISTQEYVEISRDPVRFGLLAQLMLASESQWIEGDEQRSEFLAPFIAVDDALAARESISDEISSDTVKSYDPADDAELVDSDEVGSDSSSLAPIVVEMQKEPEEAGGTVRKSPRLGAVTPKKPRLKKGEMAKEAAAFEKRMSSLAQENVTISQEEWAYLLKKAETFGFYDALVSWVCKHRALVTLSQFSELVGFLCAQEWKAEADFKAAGIKPIKRWHELDGDLFKSIVEAIRLYAGQEKEELIQLLSQELKLGVGKPYESLIVRLCNAMCAALSGKPENGAKKISLKNALKNLTDLFTPGIKDENPVVVRFAHEVNKVMEMKEYGFESEWNHVKGFFYLLLDLTLAYSQKLEEEVLFLIPDQADGDLAEIMRLAVEKRFKKDPGYEGHLCKLLHDAVDLQGGQPLRDLTEQLGTLIFEADPINSPTPEYALEEGPALECLRAIIEQQDGDIADEQLLAAFAHGWSARLDDEHFVKLVEVAKRLDETFGKKRLEATRNCITLLEDWAIRSYENLAGAVIDASEIRRLTQRAFRIICDAKKLSLLEEDDKSSQVQKSSSVKKADKKVEKKEKQHKLTAPVVEGISSTLGIEFGRLIETKSDNKNDSVKKKSKKKREADTPTPPGWQFSERKQKPVENGVAHTTGKSVKARMQEQREDEDGLSSFSRRKKKALASAPPRKALPMPPASGRTSKQNNASELSDPETKEKSDSDNE